MKKATDQPLETIQSTLRRRFRTAEVRRQNEVSIWVRIIDPKFRRHSFVEREKMVEPLLARLPQAIEDDITLLLLLSPEEVSHSMMNAEFDGAASSTVA